MSFIERFIIQCPYISEGPLSEVPNTVEPPRNQGAFLIKFNYGSGSLIEKTVLAYACVSASYVKHFYRGIDLM